METGFHGSDGTLQDTGMMEADMTLQDYQAELKRLGMDEQGMLTKVPVCRGCGKTLNADGGHSAELYAGTYTGLCYDCERRGPVVIDTLVSEARVWSCPPHCPSWRRDREQFFQFEGCSCDHGRTWETSRSFGVSNRYPVQCRICSSRHYQHPVVRAQAKVDAEIYKAVSLWEHRISKEVRHRMRQRGIGSDDRPGIQRIFDEVIKEAQPKPAEGIPVMFPKHWKG